MKCEICEQVKDDYNFFKYRNHYGTAFFLDIVPKVDTCWQCAGPYKCIECEQVKPASAFRVGGRICSDCKPRRIKDL